jgi:hypothetical protein
MNETTRPRPIAVRLGKTFDVSRLLDDVSSCESLGGVWIPETYNGNTEDHDNWTVMPLRSRGGRTGDGSAGTETCDPYEDTPLMQRAPYVREILSSLQCHWMSVRFSRLPPGAIIHEHRDGELVGTKPFARLHIPITSNDDVAFLLGGERQSWKPGELWWGDFRQLHSVRNNGADSRIHLLMDAILSPFLKDLFPPEFDFEGFEELPVSSVLESPWEFECRMGAAPPALLAAIDEAGLAPEARDQARGMLEAMASLTVTVRAENKRLAVYIGSHMISVAVVERLERRISLVDLPAYFQLDKFDDVGGIASASFVVKGGDQLFSVPIRTIEMIGDSPRSETS